MTQRKKILFWFILLLVYAVLFAVFYWLDTLFHPHATRQSHLTDAAVRWVSAVLINAFYAFLAKQFDDKEKTQ